MPETLVLRRPRRDEENEFMRAHRATTPEVPSFLHYHREGMAFSRYLEVLDEQERGVNLPPNHVPSTFLFAFKGQRIIGRVSIRHRLNDFLLRLGGHIGYVVVPEFRRQGYATAILRLALHIACEKLGIDRALVTCDDDNIGSIRTIENNGGVLENVITGRDLDKPKRRYWIDTRGGAGLQPLAAGGGRCGPEPPRLKRNVGPTQPERREVRGESIVGRGQFRFSYLTPDYDSTVAFYRDGLDLPLLESWDRDADDRGALFAAASGIIEVLVRPKSGDSFHFWDDRPPQGAFMVIEVEDVEQTYRRAIGKGLPIQQHLTTQPWGHRSFCVREPNGLTLYFFTETKSG